MFRHRRLRDASKIGQCMDGLLAFTAQSLEDSAACTIAEGFEKGIGIGFHAKTITQWLWNFNVPKQLCPSEVESISRMKAAAPKALP
jgi:hypothetical protein